MFQEIFSRTIEYRSWGLNASTVSFLATVFFTTFLGWAFWRQDKIVRDRRSGKSVSAIWHTYYAFYSVSALIYGLQTSSGALLYNGLLCIPRFFVIAGLIKYKGFAPSEKNALVAFALMPVVLLAAPGHDAIFLGISFGSVIAFAFQPFEIWRSKDAGDVDIRLLVTYGIANGFWVVYAYATHIRALMIISPLMLFLSIVTITLWYFYRRKKLIESI